MSGRSPKEKRNMSDETKCKHNYLMRLEETPLHGPGEYYCKGNGAPEQPGCGKQFKLVPQEPIGVSFGKPVRP